ncbi:hypothetical protein [Erythrobacter sanguineus]|uniref:hypothetical protein n=1 Tax=Erythrobacter sanguineus TaxID=198312 RepID=UPI001160CD3F|nr:hypothetical protein [Erythrobacter sanguineus]
MKDAASGVQNIDLIDHRCLTGIGVGSLHCVAEGCAACIPIVVEENGRFGKCSRRGARRNDRTAVFQMRKSHKAYPYDERGCGYPRINLQAISIRTEFNLAILTNYTLFINDALVIWPVKIAGAGGNRLNQLWLVSEAQMRWIEICFP